MNFVRLGLASAVVISHAFPLGGFGPEPRFGDLTLGMVAVTGFFSLSGYLIGGSRARLSLGAFVLARAMRIFPGYWLALVAVAFVFGPAAAVITGTSADWRGGFCYVVVNSSTWLFQWTVGTALAASSSPDLWNGPLWTLALELGCYAVVGLVFCSSWVRAHQVWFATWLLAMVTVINVGVFVLGGHLGQFMLLDFLRLLGFFAAGMWMWALRSRLRVRLWAVGLCAAACAVTALTNTVSVLAPIPVAYLALVAGAAMPIRWGANTDLSYGIYLFGWPVQQTLSLLGAAQLGEPFYAVAGLCATAGVASLSWRFIERPALRYKRLVIARPPGRQVPQGWDRQLIHCDSD